MMGEQRNGKAWLSRLARDERGNVLALTAAALIPILALAGSAVDTSRMYFVRVRLQQACDAGALAGRKFMVGTTYDTNANTQAERFFNNNFKAGIFGTTNVTKSFSKNAQNQVEGTAGAVVPMTIMSIFGISSVPINVVCEAKLEIPNLDVMFVLDTTGSMSEINPGDTVSRIAALRAAVTSFFTTVEAAKTASAQTRYGFVPYSNTVNVGLLLRREWMVDSWTYQSREPADITTSTSTSTQGQWITNNGPSTFTGSRVTSTSNGRPEACYAPASTRTQTSSNTGWQQQPDGSQTNTFTVINNGSDFSASLSNGVCTITETRYTNYRQVYTSTRTPNPNAGQQTTTTSNTWWWNYKPVTFNLTSLKGTLSNGLMAGGTLTPGPLLQGGNGSVWAATNNIQWGAGSAGACIEERETVRETNYSPIPTSAIDLDIDRIPDPANPATQWRPFIPRLVYPRRFTNYTSSDPSVSTANWPADVTATVRWNGNYVVMSSFPNDYAACPSAARKLATMTQSQLTTYLNGLSVAGRTYHDIGFLWGLRLLSPTGLFASENATASNGSQIVRNIIFMTDGATETNFADYDAYGLAALDRRRTPANRLPSGNSETTGIVESRLTALCRAAQARDITVWVIAFGTTLTPLLQGCARDNAHAFQANNAAELNSAFASIAANIAKLRVSK
jgi:Flp pilus assembly protein TadG